MSETFATTGGGRQAALERLFQPAGVEGRTGGLKDSPSRYFLFGVHLRSTTYVDARKSPPHAQLRNMFARLPLLVCV